MVFVLPKDIPSKSEKAPLGPFMERFNFIFFLFNIFQRNLVFSSGSIDAFLQNYHQSYIKPPAYLVQAHLNRGGAKLI